MSSCSMTQLNSMALKAPAGQEDDRITFTGERFLPGYNDGAIELEHLHRYVFALRYATGLKVLDIACGEGYGSDLLAQAAAEVIGVDLDERCIASARERYARPNLRFLAGSATDIPVESGAIDLVVSFETIEHLDNQDTFWREIRRVLRPGGVLIVSSPNRDSYREERSSNNPFHVLELTEAELCEATASHFAHHQLLSQFVAYGSQILPASPDGAYWEAEINPETRILSGREGQDVMHPYSVVLASDQPLPPPSHSLYRGHYPRGAMASLIGGIVERDEQLRILREQLREEATSIDALRLQLANREMEVQQRQAELQQSQADAAQLTTEIERYKAETERLKATLSDTKDLLQAAGERQAQDQLRIDRAAETLLEKQCVIDAMKRIIASRTEMPRSPADESQLPKS